MFRELYCNANYFSTKHDTNLVRSAQGSKDETPLFSKQGSFVWALSEYMNKMPAIRLF